MTGLAWTYDLRYSLWPIDESNFSSALQAIGAPLPRPAGTSQTFTVAGLYSGLKYYFALKTRDDAGNWSAISNVTMKMATTTVDVPLATFTLGFSAPRANPARRGAAFMLTLPEVARVEIMAFDVQGRQVRSIASGEHPAGED